MKQTSVSALVRADYRAADVFQKWGINFCCSGDQPLATICETKDLDIAHIEAELAKATAVHRKPQPDAASWPIPFLIDYIIHVHHDFIRDFGARLHGELLSFVSGHEARYPQLTGVLKAWERLFTGVQQLVEEEEQRSFPYMRELFRAHTDADSYGRLYVRTMRKPWTKLQELQTQVDKARIDLRGKSENFSAPEKACTRFQMLYQKMRAFDDDLGAQFFLEQTILLPGLRDREEELLRMKEVL